MAAVNSVQSGLHLPLTGLAPPRVLMCSASMGAEGSVTLQLREAVQAPDSSNSLDTALTIGYPDPEILADVLGTLQAAALNNNNNNTTTVVNTGNNNCINNSLTNMKNHTTNHNNIVSTNVSTNTIATVNNNNSSSSNSSNIINNSNITISNNSNSNNHNNNNNNSMNTNTNKNNNNNNNNSNCSNNNNNNITNNNNNSNNSNNNINNNNNNNSNGTCNSNSNSSTSSSSNSSSSTNSCSNEGTSVPPSNPPIVVKKARPKTSSPTRHGPQQCQVCSKIFGNASALAKHKLTHSDERKYVCAMCSKAFKRQDHLNGHMLTHRNKKPYECKAEGCGKSYCDARSLRRHTENHHGSLGMTPTTPNQSLSPSLGPPTGLSLSPATASGDASSPHGATCIQYINNGDMINSKPSSPSSPAGAGNEGLTRQQLDLISQIMQQTKQATAQITVSTTNGGGIKTQQQQSQRPRTWNMQTQLQQSQSKSSQNSVETVGTITTSTFGANGCNSACGSNNAQQISQQQHQHQHTQSNGALNVQHQQIQQQQHQQQQQQQQQQQISHALNIIKVEQKPVECNLCHRKFKNIPALNGHMRLHGGYFKKDTETKKCEKKESSGPPLQTASIGVRALIEEKIISKRSKDLKGAFVVPAPPLTSVRKIESENSFLTPKTPNQLTVAGTTTGTITNMVQGTVTASMQLQKQNIQKVTSVATSTQNATTDTKDATLIELLKRGTKLAVKRTCSDPGQIYNNNTSTIVLPSDPSISATNTPNPTPPLAISLPGESTPLSLTISQATNGAGDVFTLTYSADSSTTFFGDSDVYSVSDTAMLLQAVDSIQLLNDSTTAEQLDEIASLSEYSLTSDNNTISDSNSLGREYVTPSKQLQAVLNSPLPEGLADFSTLHSKDYVLYNCTNNASPATQSSVSPLPSPLAYPTPPASHEAVAQSSPFLDDSHHFSETNAFFDEKVSNSFIEENSSQFFKSTNDANMTENEKILKLKNELFNESKSVLEVNDTFFKTEDTSDVFDNPVKVEDLLNENNGEPCDLKDFSTQNLSFLDEPQNFLDDTRNPPSPLSESFFTSAITSAEEVKEALKDVLPNETLHNESSSTNDIDLYYLPGLTLQSQMMSNSDDPLLSSSPKDFVQRVQLPQQQQHQHLHQQQQIQIPLASIKQETGQIYSIPNAKKIRSNEDLPPIITVQSQHIVPQQHNVDRFVSHAANFNNNNTVVISHPTAPPPLPPVRSNFHQTFTNSILKRRLRQGQTKKTEIYRSKLRKPSTTHYTPSPMLNPDRKSSGLYSNLPKAILQDTIDLVDEFDDAASLVAFLDDSKVNIGTAYQATIPSAGQNSNYNNEEYDELMWDPNVTTNDKLLTRFIELSKSSAVPLGFHSEEVALKALLDAQGETHIAVLNLLQTPSNHVHLKWSTDQIEAFLKGLEKHGKNFYRIAKEISLKSSGDCIQLYYFWKKLCADYKITHLKQDSESSIDSNQTNQSHSELRPHVCEMPDCSASFTSKAALHGHTRIHCIGRNLNHSGNNSQTLGHNISSSSHGTNIKDDFPCKVCGKVFSKVKSRSAHMKSHRPQENDPNINS